MQPNGPAYLQRIPSLSAALIQRMEQLYIPLTPQEEALADRELHRLKCLVREARRRENDSRREPIEPEAPFGTT